MSLPLLPAVRVRPVHGRCLLAALVLRFVCAGCSGCLLALAAALFWMPATANAEEEKVPELFQELFLGESIYPQDTGELQFTTGYFWGEPGQHDAQIPVLFEYGITDYFQVGVLAPIQFLHTEDEAAGGVGSIELEVYWNFLNDPVTGWAMGVGCGVGLRPATVGVGEDAWSYEPFVVVYKTWGNTAVNFSASYEVEDPNEADEPLEHGGDLAIALIHAWEPFVFLLEADAEITAEGTSSRIAPGIYWKPSGRIWEWGVSLPIGVSGDVPDLGVFTQLTFEFGGDGD